MWPAATSSIAVIPSHITEAISAKYERALGDREGHLSSNMRHWFFKDRSSRPQRCGGTRSPKGSR
jgi:hypothetical protein